MATSIGELLDTLTVTGELYEKLEDNAVRCFACGHRCVIREGRRGICQVRFNEAESYVCRMDMWLRCRAIPLRRNHSSMCYLEPTR